jgi:hypothetical protein
MNWKYGENEYVKIFRKLINWEWFTDVNTCHLFVYCLLKANWKDGSWKGIAYKRGQFITSLETMSQETGLSVRKVRTALKHLILTNEVTNQVTSNYRLISVVNYDLYQSKRQTERQGDDKAVTKQRQSDDNSIRNIKNNKEVEEYNMASPEEDDEEGYVVPRRGEDGKWIV